MLKLYKLMFFSAMVTGSLIAISAYSWLTMWIGLEINLLSIIPLFKSHMNQFPAEATLKYFITQALASAIILFSIIFSMNTNFFVWNEFWTMSMNSAFLMKLGAAPFHSWMPEVAEGLTWMNNLILMTWQKIAPIILIMYNMDMPLFFSTIIILSSILGGIYGLNQISLRKILAYSSITHIAWMLASLLNNQMIWLIYFMIYSLISANIIMIFSFLNIFYLNQLFNMLNNNKMIKWMFIMNFFSLGGLPPFLGFLPKWLVINFLINNKFYTLSLILIIFTLLTLFFYTRITFSTLMFKMNENLIKIHKFSKFNWTFLNILMLMSLFICTMIFTFL
uniref:NADH-ubiquinone oxidoreductase chain 2 n=2 Tax=Psylliodes TaxID=294691 RepID=A0A7L9K3C5_9CUCU|nr:NADH dehydrogenase subunit 2 [Psylliodes chlorophana]QOH99577.1 NADH dehydrogenase subunit 2 [Psylliodes chlorophana]QOK35978.1 NADH dehydrogenase subunit 2 [Psylliodes punctifrons]